MDKLLEAIAGVGQLAFQFTGVGLLLMLALAFVIHKYIENLKESDRKKGFVLDGLDAKYNVLWQQQHIMFEQQKALVTEVTRHLDQCHEELRTTKTRVAELEAAA